MADNEGVRRRDVLKGLGVTGAAAGIVATTVPATVTEAPAQPATQPLPAGQQHAHAPARNGEGADTFRFFTAPEAAVVVALVDTLIPKDDVGPGGVEVGVPIFIDRQMVSAYGRGARMYLDGPFGEGTPQQGYQLPLPPAELYRVGLADLNAWCAKTRGGKTFDQLVDGRSHRRAQGGRGRQGGVRAGSAARLLQHPAAEHHGGIFRRSDPRRQSQQCGVEDDRLPRRDRHVCRRHRTISQQEI